LKLVTVEATAWDDLMRPTRYGVNWACIGKVCPSKAKRFAWSILCAVTRANRLNERLRAGKPSRPRQAKRRYRQPIFDAEKVATTTSSV